MNLISIDPGASGGIASCIKGKVECWKMPATQPDILLLIAALREQAHHTDSIVVTCYIEDIPKYVGENVPSSSIFVMAENFGYIKGALQALGIRTIQVTPQKWQKELGLGNKGLQKATPGMNLEQRAAIKRHNQQAKAEWKRKLRGEAQRRYPALAATLATADALLILDYAKIAENVREVEQATPFALKG